MRVSGSNSYALLSLCCVYRYSQRSAAMKSHRCVELHAPSAYGHAAYDFAAGHSVLSSSDYIFRDGPRHPSAFAGPTLPQDLYKSPSSNDYAYIQVIIITRKFS